MILFFSSPIGLGHITRDIAIMEKIIREYNYTKFSIVTGSTAYHFLSNLANSTFDLNVIYNLYFPPSFSITDGKLIHGFYWLLRYVYYYNQCKKNLQRFFFTENRSHLLSDVIISDEDFASLVFTEKFKSKRIFITDILSTQFSRSFLFSTFEKKLNNSMSALIRSAECVILPEIGEDLDNLFYVGPIVREIQESRNKLRKKLSFDKKTILLSVGGTNSGIYLLKKTIESFLRLKNNKEYDLVILSSYQFELPKLDSHCKFMGIVSNGHEYVKSCDLLISLAGKSTIDESMVYGIPGIFIPIKNHFEQECRAASMGFKYDDIYNLDRLIEERLSSFDHATQVKVDNGVMKSAEIIYSFLE